MARRGKVRQGAARCGPAWKGKDGRGVARQGNALQGLHQTGSNSMTRFCLIFLFALLAAACAPTGTATLDPRVQVAAMNEMDKINATATAMAKDVNNAAFNQSLTQAFVPPALTATALNQHATELANASAAEYATQVAFNYSTSITLTEQAFMVIESDTQRQVAENNRAIADSVHGGELWRSTIGFLVGLGVFGFGVVVVWLAFQVCIHIYNRRKIADKGAAWTEIFKQEKAMLALGVAQTSAGPTSYNAVTLAEKHVAQYDNASRWRGLLKSYVARCIELSRSGVKQPFSRPTCARYAILTKPDEAEWWQLGHERVVKLLFGIGVLKNETGQGGPVVLAVDADSVWRVIDTAPLPDLPPDPIPACKMTLATSQA